MAVEIFKLNENNKIVSTFVAPERLKANLNAGWTVDIKELNNEEKEIRDKAKELGISHWWTKNLDKLKEEIVEHDNED